MIVAEARTNVRKWRAIFSIWLQDAFAYPTNGVIWILTDVTTAVTMPLVWAAAAKNGMVGGYSVSEIVFYYLSMLLLNSFITSHIMWDLAMEIKEGQFSTSLLRPVSFYQFTFFRNLSWRTMRILVFTPFCFLLLYCYRGFLTGSVMHLSPAFFASVVLGHLVSFNIVMTLSMIAFFTQEAMSIFEIYYIPMLFLSGQLFPVSLMPKWAGELSHWLPFYYTVGAPTEMLVGRTPTSSYAFMLGMQVAWVVISYLVGRVLWKGGLKHYSGVGM